jgi:phosphoribosyl 1,2-cyclic phosphodiesterase
MMSAGTAAAIGCDKHRRCYTIKASRQDDFHGWIVLPFSVIHDCAEPLGFLLQSKSTKEKLLFATDTAYIGNRFEGLNYIMVECNYDDATMQENIAAGVITFAQYDRVLKTHFGLERVVEFIKANDVSQVKEIHLLHLSSGNSNRERIESTIKRLTGTPVYVAALR